MRQTVFTISLAAALFCSARAAEYLSPSDLQLIDSNKTLLVAEHTGKRIDFFDTSAGKTIRSVGLPGEPRGMVCSADGKTAYIAAGESEGIVYVLDITSGKTVREIPVGRGPVSPLLSPDGRTLYVCNRFDNAVGIIDLKEGRQRRSVPVVREPVAAALTPDGRLLFVANHLPDGPATADYVAAKVSVIDTETGTLIQTVQLINGAQSLRGAAVSPDGKYAYVTHLVSNYQLPTTQLERGWINTDAFSIIRIADFKLFHTVLLDDVDRGFANPWGIAVSADGKTLCVVSAGNNELSVIDLKALHSKIEALPADTPDAYDDLLLLSGVRRRVPLKGTGPRNLLLHEDTLYIAEYFSGSLGTVHLRDGAVQSVESVPLGPEPPLTPARRGEMLFNDSRLCFQNWMSCASCHPDVRADALNWDLLNDGIGNPKNTKSLILSPATPPAMWLGVRNSAAVAVRAGMHHILFSAHSEKNAKDIDAYLGSLHPVPGPHRTGGGLSPSAKRGKKIFKAAGCIRCHPAPLFTDLQVHDVGTTGGKDDGRPVDTPSLVELWRTAPYLHDGRAATLREVLGEKGHASIWKGTSGLSEKQRQELEAYLLSL
jgi:YVTN family beta-propeller protein